MGEVFGGRVGMTTVGPAWTADATVGCEFIRLSLVEELSGGDFLVKKAVPSVACIQRDPETPKLFPF